MPPLDGLRAFEVAARRLNFTEAAEELRVTQGAVSQRIKTLERELGVPLFRRLARGLELTEEGERLAEGVRLGLEQIERSLASVVPARAAGPLIVSVLPSFAARWLVPRLHRFARLHADTHLQVLSEQGLADLRSRKIHAALRFGGGQYPGLSTTTILRDTVIPVCSPSLLGTQRPVRVVADLTRLPILRDSSADVDDSGTGWPSWLRFVGAADLELPAGQQFSQADHVIEAAAGGLGVALARASLIGADLTLNRLVKLPLPAMPTTYAYHLVCCTDMRNDPRLQRFRSWLLWEAKAAAESSDRDG